MNNEPRKKIKSTSLMTTLLMTFLILASATVSASSYLIGSVNGQVGADTDGDGLLDTWEKNGIDANNDGIIDFVLPQADPMHKNLYVEVDYMQFHRPIGGGGAFGSIQDVRSAFSRSPVPNPDGTTGINLFVLVDEQIPHQNTTDVNGLRTIKSQSFGTVAERANANSVNLLAAKRMAFHYAVFAHDQPGENSGSSGVSDNGVPGNPGMNFLVTLGNGWAVDASTGHSVGSRDQQAGTFIHELGHNLGLQHGGGDGVNCKNNYFSVMNYIFQFSNFVSSRPLDYSRSALDTLNKTNLSEPDGIAQSTPPDLMTQYGPDGPGQGPELTAAGVPVDWNFDGDSTDEGVNADINGGLTCGTPGPPGLSGLLNGFNDWTNLKYIVAQGLSGQTLQVPNEQTLQVPNEQTMNDVRGSRLVLLKGVDNAIQRLVESQPGTSTQKPTGEFDTTYLVQLLKTDQLGVAIEELTNLEAKVIQVFGEKAAGKEVVPQIENLIGALEKDDQQQQQQQQQQQKEETMNDVVTSRLELLEGVDNAIQRLVESEPGTPIQKPTGGFDIIHIIQLLKTDQINAAIEELTKLRGFDTTHIIQLLKTDQINAAIEELTRLEPGTSIQKPTEEGFDTTHIAQLLKTEQLDAAIAKLTKLEAKVIKVFGEEAAGKEVVPEIENLIGALQKQEFSPPSSSPPSAVLLS
jgi:hypothetical protein